MCGIAVERFGHTIDPIRTRIIAAELFCRGTDFA
jgi:hypothetical protein